MLDPSNRQIATIPPFMIIPIPIEPSGWNSRGDHIRRLIIDILRLPTRNSEEPYFLELSYPASIIFRYLLRVRNEGTARARDIKILIDGKPAQEFFAFKESYVFSSHLNF